MDFHSMKRKRLQSLCKKHGIPANLKNKDMADRLSLLFKGMENAGSCGSDNAGSEKDMVDVQTGELNSTNGNNLKMVASDTVTGNVEEEKEKFVTSGKRSLSPNLEERIGFSPKLLKKSEIVLEPKLNFSPEKTRDEIEICDLEGNMQSGTNKGQVEVDVDDIQEDGVVIMKDVDLVHVASDEFGDHLVDAKVEKWGENTNVHDDACGTGKSGGETEKQDYTNPQESNINDVNLLLASSEEYGYSLVDGEVHKSDDNICVHGSVCNIVNKEQLDDSVMNNADLVHVGSDEFSNNFVESQVEKLDDKTDLHENVCGTGKGGSEAVKQDDTNSPQGSNINDVNLVHVSPEESSYHLVEGEVQKSDVTICFHGADYNSGNSGYEVDTMNILDTSIENKDTDGKTNVTMEHFPDEVNSCSFKYSDGTPDQVLTTYRLSEVKSTDLNIDQMVGSDPCEEKLESPQKKGLVAYPKDCIGFYSKHLEASEIKVFEAETNFEDGMENAVSCSSDNAGSEKDMVDVQTCELNSRNGNNLKMAASDTVTGNVEERKENFVTSGKRSLSPNLEKRIGFSPKLLKKSEIEILESKLSLSPEKTNDIGICDLEGNMQSGLNKGQVDVDDSKEGLHSAPDVVIMKNVDLVQVASKEFGDHLVEAEVEKLGDNTSIHGDACGSGKSGGETEKQDYTNPQGSNINDVNLLLASSEEYDYPFVDGEVPKSDDNICVHGSVCNIVNKEQIDDSVMNNVYLVHVASDEFGNYLVEGEVEKLVEKTGVHEDVCGTAKGGAEDEKQDVNNSPQGSNAKDTDGKTNVTADHFLDEMPGDLNIHQMVVSGTATGNADACESKFVSSPKINLTPDSEKIGFFPKLLNNSETKGLESEMNLSPETPRDDIGLCDVEENMQEQVHDSQEVLHAVPSAVADLVQVSSEEFGNHFVESEVEKLGDKADLHENVCGTGKGGSEAAKQDETNSPQGSKINDVNVVHVSPEESGYPLVEGEVQKSDVTISVHEAVYNSGNSGSEIDTMYLLDTSIENKDTNGKTNVTMEHFPDEVNSCSFKYSDGTPDLVLTTYPLSEVKSTDLNIHQTVGSDTCEEKLESPQKKDLVADPKECIKFYSKHLEASEIETNFDPSTLGDIVTLGTCTMKESMQSVKTGLDAHPEQCTRFSPKHLEASVIACLEAETNFNPSTVGDILGTCSMEESLQKSKNEKVDYNEEVLQTTMNDVVINDVDLLQRSMEECNLVQGGFTKLFDNFDADDADNASDQNSDETPEEFVQTMPQPDQNKSCTFSIHQLFASDTASGDEDTYQDKLESPPKCTPNACSEESISLFPNLLESSTMKRELEIETNLALKSARDTLGTCDMKENINMAKKEQVGSVISKKTFPKRQPLQDLQQK